MDNDFPSERRRDASLHPRSQYGTGLSEATFKAIRQLIEPGVLLMDVGSTKREVVDAAYGHARGELGAFGGVIDGVRHVGQQRERGADLCCHCDCFRNAQVRRMNFRA